ncbi:MAG: hypothetical protein LBI74_05095, partial [Synergistaceae bacterium]|nr:hypothetical protein [Synergistaceae bacterium]
HGIYRTKLLKIAKPEFYVLYNGSEEFPDRHELKLSDAFWNSDTQGSAGGFLELIVPIYNINEGRNEDIVRRSETLFGYAAFIAQVRRYVEEGYELGGAIGQAVNNCVERGILAEFLRVNASEGINLLIAEFKMEEAVKVWKEEGIEIGMEKGMEKGIEIGKKEGMEKGKFEVARKMLARKMSVSDIVEMTGLNEKDVLSL